MCRNWGYCAEIEVAVQKFIVSVVVVLAPENISINGHHKDSRSFLKNEVGEDIRLSWPSKIDQALVPQVGLFYFVPSKPVDDSICHIDWQKLHCNLRYRATL